MQENNAEYKCSANLIPVQQEFDWSNNLKVPKKKQPLIVFFVRVNHLNDIAY